MRLKIYKYKLTNKKDLLSCAGYMYITAVSRETFTTEPRKKTAILINDGELRTEWSPIVIQVINKIGQP